MTIDPKRAIGNPDKEPNDASGKHDDDATQVSGNSGKNHPKTTETKEFRVKWCINNALEKTKAKTIYAGLLATLMESHPDEVIILDHNREEHVWDAKYTFEEQVEYLKKSALPINEAQSKSEKKFHRWYATHTIRSSLSLSDLKNHYQVSKIIKQTNAYATIHHFALKEWDIAHLGFLRGWNNIHINVDAATARLQKASHQIDTSCPKFKIATTRIRPSNKPKKLNFSTQAYEVQCLRDESKQMAKILTSGSFREQMTFIPYSYKHTKPEIFLNALRSHEKELRKTWVLKIHGFTEETIDHVKEELLRSGATDITPSYRGKDTGEWKILLGSDIIRDYYEWLTHTLPTIVSKIPDEIKAKTPPNFPSPAINSRPPAAQQDDGTVGDDDSYATMLSNAMSIASVDYGEFEAEEAASNIPSNIVDPTIKSYAQATKTDVSDITSAQKSQPATPSSTDHSNMTDVLQQLETSKAEQDNLRAQLQRVTNVVEQQAATTSKLELLIEKLLAQMTHAAPVASDPHPLTDTPEKPKPKKRQNVNHTPTKLIFNDDTTDSTEHDAEPPSPDTDQAMQE
jgi:hypothetical protein